MEFTFTTPTALFGMISLLMLAYTNRFLGLARLIRDLHAQWTVHHHPTVHAQIGNLRRRIRLIRAMQFLGALAILLSLLSMACIGLGRRTTVDGTVIEAAGTVQTAQILFALALGALVGSTAISLWEIAISADALEIELADMEEGKKEGAQG